MPVLVLRLPRHTLARLASGKDPHGEIADPGKVPASLHDAFKSVQPSKRKHKQMFYDDKDDHFSFKKSKNNIVVATRPAPGSRITYAKILTPDPKDSSRLTVKDGAVGLLVSANANSKGTKTH
jgi:hypothetical protein